MRNSIGHDIVLTLFGESHSDMIGAVLDGLPAGIEIDNGFIESQLARRRPQGSKETARVEMDNYKIVSGVFNGFTTGEPLCILMENTNTMSKDYEKTRALARPSHADYVSHIVHNGYEDYRGGGHFSGRLTAPIVALGAICQKMLENIGIYVGTHILSCGKVSDRNFSGDSSVLENEIKNVNSKQLPVLNFIDEQIENEIAAVRAEKDSIGGVIQTAIVGLPVGVGEPWFGSLEGVLANAMLSIGGIKGIEFGLGFGFGAPGCTGKSANDEFYSTEDGRVMTYTNNNGGINGGYSNGMPVVFNCAVKPTPSIASAQRTINMETGENEIIEIVGRHDPAIIRRVCIVACSLTCIVLCDMLKTKFSNNIFK